MFRAMSKNVARLRYTCIVHTVSLLHRELQELAPRRQGASFLSFPKDEAVYFIFLTNCQMRFCLEADFMSTWPIDREEHKFKLPITQFNVIRLLQSSRGTQPFGYVQQTVNNSIISSSSVQHIVPELPATWRHMLPLRRDPHLTYAPNDDVPGVWNYP